MLAYVLSLIILSFRPISNLISISRTLGGFLIVYNGSVCLLKFYLSEFPDACSCWGQETFLVTCSQLECHERGVEERIFFVPSQNWNTFADTRSPAEGSPHSKDSNARTVETPSQTLQKQCSHLPRRRSYISLVEVQEALFDRHT